MFVFLWAFYASSIITLLPVWEGRRSIKSFALFMIGKSKTTKRGNDIDVMDGLEPQTMSDTGTKAEETVVTEKGTEIS